ncbi:hypothetical protein VNO77_05901 [Canavalia gladiata]|uniref:Uncharacterized protein n=1 Tax=Canavalia gladiata TaxID=3824 RepID=A0AAN9MZX4_CANGL
MCTTFTVSVCMHLCINDPRSEEALKKKVDDREISGDKLGCSSSSLSLSLSACVLFPLLNTSAAAMMGLSLDATMYTHVPFCESGLLKPVIFFGAIEVRGRIFKPYSFFLVGF